mmetsp:Transcript_29798/g.45437  ORF Transcript_29798/g.45437 Transcript_29798/m.45437 type:complete len:331 (+) Transcript_29798:226-1218(+)
MTFPAPYMKLPSSVKLKLKASQEKLELTEEAEEMATWWADCELTEFGEKEKVRENFWNTFKSKIDKKYNATALDLLDFSDIRTHIEAAKEEKKNRPTEVKKKEIEDRQKVNAAFQNCLFDGFIEKVANYNIEPPSIFRGRGEHPHAGKLKSRIVPEYVSINIGLDDPIPPCPIKGHAWKKVVNNPEATWLCHFKDEQNTYSSSGKYLFLAAESKIKGMNDLKKYERARRLKAIIDKVREVYVKDMVDKHDYEKNQLGVATYLIDKLALRVGNEKGEDEADTVGCCSLRVEHITIEEEKHKVSFDFLGKDSMRYHNTVDVIPEVYELMKRF